VLTDRQKKILERVVSEAGSKEISIEKVESISKKTKVPPRFIEWFTLEKGIVPSRYQRNIGSLGIEGQKKLLESSAIVVGLGGLGGFVCEHLARAGAGKISGIDPDVFDQTNLNRQLFADSGNIGKKKTIEAGKRIKKINASVEYKGYSKRFSRAGNKIWQQGNIVFDCLNNISDRLLLAKKCSEANLPLIHSAIAGWYGQVAVVWPQSHIIDRIYSLRSEGLEKKLGTPVWTAATAAGIMTAGGIKVLLGKIARGENKILCFDLMEDRWQTMKF
jgi:molybdopterin/thiamine biosynthesis adenylyltransferase